MTHKQNKFGTLKINKINNWTCPFNSVIIRKYTIFFFKLTGKNFWLEHRPWEKYHIYKHILSLKTNTEKYNKYFEKKKNKVL